MKKEKKVHSFYIEKAILKRLRAYCKTTGRVQGIFVEIAIEEKLARDTTPKPFGAMVRELQDIHTEGGRA